MTDDAIRISRRRSTPIISAPISSEVETEEIGPDQDSWTPTSQSIESITDLEPSSLQPSGLLNHKAMRGKFSLGYILSTSDGPLDGGRAGTSFAPTEDPILLGLVNLAIAKSLFQKYV